MYCREAERQQRLTNRQENNEKAEMVIPRLYQHTNAKTVNSNGTANPEMLSIRMME